MSAVDEQDEINREYEQIKEEVRCLKRLVHDLRKLKRCLDGESRHEWAVSALTDAEWLLKVAKVRDAGK